jgi:N-acetylmuramoyl-L-alanine amidase
MKKIKNDLNTILDDLGRKYKNEESMRLAYSVQNTIVKTLKKDYRRIEDLGVKYALFFVLLGAEMPSILVEISFISNREEEKRLSMDSYKNKIAEAIAKGINSYVTQSTLIVNPVKERDREIVSNGVKKTGDEIQPQG